jgi:hypothetical protein
MRRGGCNPRVSRGYFPLLCALTIQVQVYLNRCQATKLKSFGDRFIVGTGPVGADRARPPVPSADPRPYFGPIFVTFARHYSSRRCKGLYQDKETQKMEMYDFS